MVLSGVLPSGEGLESFYRVPVLSIRTVHNYVCLRSLENGETYDKIVVNNFG